MITERPDGLPPDTTTTKVTKNTKKYFFVLRGLRAFDQIDVVPAEIRDLRVALHELPLREARRARQMKVTPNGRPCS